MPTCDVTLKFLFFIDTYHTNSINTKVCEDVYLNIICMYVYVCYFFAQKLQEPILIKLGT